MEWTYDENDIILYNLGLGCKQTEQKYVYENSEDFVPMPSFQVLALHRTAERINMQQYVNNFNPMMLLHGEQYIELHQPLPVSGTLEVKGEVVAVQKKGSSALLVIGVTLTDAKTKQMTSYAEASIFLRGAEPSAEGLQRRSERPEAAVASNSVPERAPDTCVEEQTSPEQAALYRLCGDPNPLHIDPEFAGLAGFPQPILHGLCSFGIGVKHVVQTYCKDDSTAVQSMKARFAKHVFPGETLRTEMWLVKQDTVVFQTKAVERDVIVLSNAAVKLSLEHSRL